MSREFLIKDSTLLEIAEAIREKLGSSDVIETKEMPSYIRSIKDADEILMEASTTYVGPDSPSGESFDLWVDTDEEDSSGGDIVITDEVVEAVLETLPKWSGGDY